MAHDFIVKHHINVEDDVRLLATLVLLELVCHYFIQWYCFLRFVSD
jgi:hypothetical protein